MTQYSTVSGILQLRHAARGAVVRTLTGSASGTLTLQGYATPTIPGLKAVPSCSGYLRLTGRARGSVNEPYGSFRDFAHYAATAVDPAMVLVRSHNGGATTSDVTQPFDYRRFYAVASTPVDYPVSGGEKLWKRAAYASIGLKFKALGNGAHEFIDGAQFEVAKHAATAPVAYQTARSLNCVVVPRRINESTNPAVVGTAGYSMFNGGSLIALTTDGVEGVGDGSTCGQFTCPTYSGLSGVILASGILGSNETRTLSAWVTSDELFFLNATGVGVVSESTPIPKGSGWKRYSLTYKGNSSGGAFAIHLVRTYPAAGQFVRFTGVLAEKSSAVGSYFDGASGADYVWDGTPNASNSLFYPDKLNRSYLISQLLAENCPLGITPSALTFGV